MKNILFITLTSLFLITSCSKDDDMNGSDIPSNTISAEINGQTFIAEAQSQINNIFVQLFTITGTVDVGNGKFEAFVIFFNIPSGETLQEDTYELSGSEECIPSVDVCASISYGVLEPDDEFEYSSLFDIKGETKIIFTDLDYRPGGSAKGSFSAVLFNEAGEEIRITNGKFNSDISE